MYCSAYNKNQTECSRKGTVAIEREGYVYYVCKQHSDMQDSITLNTTRRHPKMVEHNPQEDTMQNTQEQMQLDDETVAQKRIREIQELKEKVKETEQRMANSRVMGIIDEGEPGVFHPDNFIVAGTGSRSLQQATSEVKNEIFNEIIEILTKFKEEYGSNLVVMSGMAEGFDKALATAAIKLEIRLHCAIPNKTYGAYYWGSHSLTGKDQLPAFNSILDNAEKVIYIMEDIMGLRGISVWRNGRRYHSNFVRNDWMVSRADHFLVYDPSSSGTGQCFASIKHAQLPYTLIPKED